MAQLDLQKLNKFQEDLSESGFSKINQKTPQPLTQQEISQGKPIVIEYYTYLSQNGDNLAKKYAELALGVVRDDTTAGKVANIHMEANALHLGRSESDLLRLKNEIPIYLAGRDIQMRMDSIENPIKNSISDHISKKIPDYHYEGFKKLGCDDSCWTATLFHKFAEDPNAWFKIVTGDESLPKMGLGKVVDAYKANAIKDGISAVASINSIARTINYEANQNAKYHQITVNGKALNVVFNADLADIIALHDHINTNSFKMLPTVLYNVVNDKVADNKAQAFHSKAPKNKIGSDANRDTCEAQSDLNFNENNKPPKYILYIKKVIDELQKQSKISAITDNTISFNYAGELHEYTVKSGETVWGIATQYGITVDQLVEISGNEFLKESRVKDSKGKDYILIKPDQKINVPAVSDPNNKENDQAPRDVRSNTKIKNALEAFNYATTFISPLVIDLDGDGIELSHVHDNPVFFDIDGDGNLEKIGWVKPDDGHLAMDRNGNGQIDDITELYGDDVMPAFKKLALHDENEDGLIDEKDSDYNKILVWRDLNQNGVSESEELKTLRETGIASISLQETKKEEYNQDNLITGTSEFTWLNGTKGEIADVHYVNDKINSWYVGKGAAFTPVAINPDVLSLPNSRGYGTLPSLHIAMSHNGELLEMVREFSDLPTNKWGELLPRIEGILFEWAGSTDAFNTRSNPDNKNNFGTDKIGFLERFTGQKYQQVGNDDLLGTFAQKELHKAFYYATYNIKMNLLVQGPLKELFKGHNLDTSYKIFQDRLKFDTTKHNIAKAVVNLALSQPDSYLAPDVFNLLLEIVFDDQNDIRSKDFSFEEQILSVMQGS